MFNGITQQMDLVVKIANEYQVIHTARVNISMSFEIKISEE
jgi:hypothetical protein